MKNDEYKPDFVAMACDKGLVREVCVGEGGERMTDEETDKVAKVTEKYYSEYWHRIIMPLLRYKKPHVAN